MNLRSLLQDILNEVSSRIISFQMRLHLLITLVRSSEYFRFIESLRTCIMASLKGPFFPNFRHYETDQNSRFCFFFENFKRIPSQFFSKIFKDLLLIFCFFFQKFSKSTKGPPFLFDILQQNEC